ncbi:MAG: HAMP domain-containing histidine kinase [Cyclobacteriaceae bacterium]|nr:HAMP domain-containing histidine kinase [Cyclobacteriaceae bacterium]
MHIFTRKSILLFVFSLFLIAIGFFVFKLQDSQYSKKDELSQIAIKLSLESKKITEEIQPVLSYLKNHQNVAFEFLNTIDTSYPYFVFKNGELSYWSSHEYVPKYVDVIGDYYRKYIETRKGKFVVLKWGTSIQEFEVFVLLPLHINSLIENQYLFAETNPTFFKSDAIQISKTNHGAMLQVCLDTSECLFFVDINDTYFTTNKKVKSSGLVVMAFGLFFLMISVFIFSFKIGKNSRGLSVIFLISVLTLIRVIMLQTDWHINAFSNSFFNPQVFASSFITPTLADLVINMTLLLLVVGYVFYVIPKDYQFKFKFKNSGSFLIGLISSLGLWQLYLLIETVYYNSNYTLDISSSVDFSKERVLVFIVLMMGGFLFILYSHIIYKLFNFLCKPDRVLISGLIFISGLLLFGGIIHVSGQGNWLTVLFSVLYFTLLIITKLPERFSNVSYQSFTYVLIGLIFASLLMTYSIKELEEKRNIENKQRFVEQFLIGNDELAEYLLSEASYGISNDAFIKSRMFTPFLSKEVVKEKVRKVFLSSYFDKYDVDIALYNAKGKSFTEESQLELSLLKEGLVNNSSTVGNNLYFISDYKEEYTKGYVSISEVKKYGLSVGFVVITLKMKKIIPDNVYPDLLVDSRFLLPYENKNFSYAIFAGGKIVYSSGEYNYQQNFELERSSGHKADDNGYCHLIVDETENRTVVVSGLCYSYFNVLSNFSFLLILMIFLVVVLLLIYGLYYYLSGKSLNYSARIQLYFNWAFFLPLIVVSSVTLSLVTNSYKEEVKYEHYKKALIIGKNIENGVGEGLSLSGEELSDKLKFASVMANTDANLFDVRGRLIASSQPLIYKKNVLSEYISSAAHAKIVERKDQSFTALESVGKLTYNATYIGIQSPVSGQLLAVLSVPYFKSEFNLEKEKIEVFVTIVNVFAVVFIGFLIISYFASKWLTFPLRFITQKLKDTTLSEKNIPLKWKSDDEIGLMVSEYNKMIVNLDESKKALARTEKESAWRTIAQQVAHEIKNPLTPMKLTLQHLQRTLLGDKHDVGLDKPVNSLMRQIDVLTDIVSSFSSFAQMPIPEHERYELTDLVKQTIALHKSKTKITEVIPNHKMFVMGDEKLMGRIILNMILNAEQSSDKQVIISLSIKNLNQSKIVIEILDNGDGIPEDVQEKIFIPNFTTKESGSGIGLAIAKHGIEHAGGKLWFETEIGRGTSFFIELPQVD